MRGAEGKGEGGCRSIARAAVPGSSSEWRLGAAGGGVSTAAVAPAVRMRVVRLRLRRLTLARRAGSARGAAVAAAASAALIRLLRVSVPVRLLVQRLCVQLQRMLLENGLRCLGGK